MEVLQVTAPFQQIAHVYVHRIKTGAMECRRHLNVGVNALLTQYSNFRTSPLGDIRCCNIFFRCEAQFDVQARIAFILLGLVLLIGTFRVIAQALHLPGRFRPPGA